MDYIFPEWVTAILKAPSEQTQMESSMVGILVMMLSSLFVTTYTLIYFDLSIWFKIFIGIGELGILSFQFALISTTYQNYNSYKLENNLYPAEYKLNMKVQEAKLLVEELNNLIKSK